MTIIINENFRIFQNTVKKMSAIKSQLYYLVWILCIITLTNCTIDSDDQRIPGKNTIISKEVCNGGSINILLYISDDHGQDLGAYGNDIIQTPNLDALADEGTRFTHAFATTASCSASRSVILSGLHNHRNGQYGHVHDYNHFLSFDHIQSVSKLLSENGYRTARSGKYHVAPEHVYPFDETLPGNSRNPVELAEETEEFIATDGNGTSPFFLLLGTSDPHRGGGRATDLPYEPDRFGNVAGGHEGVNPVEYDPSEVLVPSWLPDNEATRQELAQYYQSVSRLDQGFGRMIEILKENGVYEQTLIIYMSDHGMAFPGAKTTVYEPGLRSPLIIRDPCASNRGLINNAMISWTDITPTILDYADVDPPSYTRHISQSVIRDFFPESHGLHGRSFRPIIEETNPEGWDEIYASHTFHEIHMYYPMRVVRDRKYKLIWNINFGRPYPNASDLQTSSTWQYVLNQESTPSEMVDPPMQSLSGSNVEFGLRTVRDYLHRPEFELYNIQEDPFESNNLADDPAYTDILQEYTGRIQEFQRRTGDPWYIHWAYQDTVTPFIE